jgi:uncharacterized protein (DUF58 family)
MARTGHGHPNRQAIAALAARYRLVVPDRQQATTIGELAGRRAGSSIEFQDRKDYVAGDDLRHIDWRAFARTDRMTVKLYREEICPSVDIVADVSASMAVTPGKAACRNDLVWLFVLLARKLNATLRLHRLGAKLEPLADPAGLDAFEEQPLDDPLPLLRAAPFARKGGVKILVSDFLFPFDPAQLVATFAQADRLVLIQVLSDFEADPPEGGILRLEEAENGQTLDLALDRATVREYRRRLDGLLEDLDRRLRVAGGALATLREGLTLEETMRALMRARIVEL